MANDGFQSRNEQMYLSTDSIQELVGKLAGAVGSPSIRGALEPMLQMAFGNAMRSQVQATGGAYVPYGGSTMFGPTNVGAELADFRQRQQVSAMMQPAFDNLHVQQMAFQMQTNRAIWGVPNTQNALGNTLTNWGANYLFGQMQPMQLLAGIEEGGRYLGVGPLSGSHNARLRDLSTGLAADFMRPENFGKYGGLKGQEVGQLYAEMARTGALAPEMRDLEKGSASLETVQSRVASAVQNAARTMSSLRQLFEGSVTEVLDQVNRLSGMNVMGTLTGKGGFGLTASALAQNTAAAGYFAGFAPQQMNMLTAASANYARATGHTSWGALGSATEVAIQTSMARAAGLDPFVDEAHYRDTLIAKVGSAHEGPNARMLAGAAALLKTHGRDYKGFLSQAEVLAGNNPLNPANLLQLLGNFGEKGVNQYDLLQMSYGRGAEMIRASGEVDHAAISSTMSRQMQSRAGLAETELRKVGIGGDRLKAIMAQLADSGYDPDQIVELSGGRVGAVQAGHLSSLFNINARAWGYSSGFEQTQAARAARQSATRQRLLDNMGFRTGLMDKFYGRGAYSGLMNFTKLINAGGADFKTFMKTMVGRVDLTDDEITGAQSQYGALQKAVDGNNGAEMGLGNAMTAVTTGMIGDRSATSEELEEAKQLLDMKRVSTNTEFGERVIKLANFGNQTSTFQQKLAKSAQDMMKKRLGAAGTKEQQANIAKLAELEKLIAADSGSMDPKAMSRRKDNQKAYSELLAKIPTVSDDDTAAAKTKAEIEAMARVTDDTTQKQKLMDISRGIDGTTTAAATVSTVNDAVGGEEKARKLRDKAYESDRELNGSLGGPQEKMLYYMEKLFHFLEDHVGGGSPAPAPNTAVPPPGSQHT